MKTNANDATQQQQKMFGRFFRGQRFEFKLPNMTVSFLLAAHKFKIAFWWSGLWRAMNRQVGRKVRRTRRENAIHTKLIKLMGKMLHLGVFVRVLAEPMTKVCSEGQCRRRQADRRAHENWKTNYSHAQGATNTKFRFDVWMQLNRPKIPVKCTSVSDKQSTSFRRTFVPMIAKYLCLMGNSLQLPCKHRSSPARFAVNPFDGLGEWWCLRSRDAWSHLSHVRLD